MLTLAALRATMPRLSEERAASVRLPLSRYHLSMRLKDIAGQRFGRLLVLSKHPSPKMWLCRCDCGLTAIVTGSNLRKGSTRSCGCLASEWATFMGSNPAFVAKRAARQVKHGHKRGRRPSAEYRVWLSMKRRCSDVRCKDYPRWGGRGIRVCDRWNESFEAFLSDMGPRPSPEHSIDRLDGFGNYEPSNCRWATPLEQAENMRTNVRVTVGGVVFTSMAAACRHFGVGESAAYERIRRGVDPATAVSHAGRLQRPRPRESYWRKDRRP